MHIEDIWKNIHYKQLGTCTNGRGERHETCVLVSFCIAAYPFVKDCINRCICNRDNREMIQYFFEKYCRYRNLNTDGCLECKYTDDYDVFFRSTAQMSVPDWFGYGYRAMSSLYNSREFEFCKQYFNLQPCNVSIREGEIYVENELKNGATSIIAYSFQKHDQVRRTLVNGIHSVAFCYSTKKKKFI